MPRRNQSRRPSGTGSIVNIGGLTYVRVRFTDEEGRKKQRYERIFTKTEAAERAGQLLNELKHEDTNAVRAERMTFAQLITEYTAVHDKAPKTYLETVKDYFGHRLLRSLKYADLKQFKTDRLATPIIWGKGEDKQTRPRKLASVHRELDVLRRILRFGHREGYLQRDLFAAGPPLILKSEEESRDRLLTPEEEKKLLAACKDQRKHLRPIIIAAIDTGLRRGDLLKLTWSQVDLARGIIRLPRSTSNKRKPAIVGLTKRLADELAALQQQSEDPAARVFGLANNFKRSFGTACRLAGIEGLHFHDLRHRFVTDAIESGIPRDLAMKASGHTQSATFDRYLNVDERIARSIAERMDQARRSA